MVDEGSSAVTQVVLDELTPDSLVLTDSGNGLEPLAKINQSLRIGLALAFEVYSAPYVIVLDDDIVVSRDFLSFVELAHLQFGGKPFFRGVNGWSAASRDAAVSNPLNRIVRTNYGYAWGWSVSAKSYDRAKKLISHKDTLGLAPDWVWEDLLRTGYMVNPAFSRIRNIGFDSTATHTQGREVEELGRRIDQSFSSAQGRTLNRFATLTLSLEPFPWGSWRPCIVWDRLNMIEKFSLLLLTNFRYQVRLLKLRANGNVLKVLDGVEKQTRGALRFFESRSR